MGKRQQPRAAPRANGVAEQVNELERQRIESEVSESAAFSVNDLRQMLADRKEYCRQTLVSLLDYLDKFPEQDRLATLTGLHREFGRTLELYWQFAKSRFPQGIGRSPRAEAYATGRADGVFRESLFG